MSHWNSSEIPDIRGLEKVVRMTNGDTDPEYTFRAAQRLLAEHGQEVERQNSFYREETPGNKLAIATAAIRTMESALQGQKGRSIKCIPFRSNSSLRNEQAVGGLLRYQQGHAGNPYGDEYLYHPMAVEWLVHNSFQHVSWTSDVAEKFLAVVTAISIICVTRANYYIPTRQIVHFLLRKGFTNSLVYPIQRIILQDILKPEKLDELRRLAMADHLLGGTPTALEQPMLWELVRDARASDQAYRYRGKTRLSNRPDAWDCDPAILTITELFRPWLMHISIYMTENQCEVPEDQRVSNDPIQKRAPLIQDNNIYRWKI